MRNHTRCRLRRSRQRKTFRRVLRKGGAINNAVSLNGSTALFMAALENDLPKVEELIAAGANVNKANREGNTPLYIACEGGYKEIVEKLLSVPGIDVNKAERRNFTPLNIACGYGYKEIVEMLLAVPEIDVNRTSIDGTSSLKHACVSNFPEIAKLLVEDPRIDSNEVAKLAKSARYGVYSEEIKQVFFNPPITKVRILPANSTNVITLESIQKGNNMVNFKADEVKVGNQKIKKMESNYGRFHLKSSYNQIPEPKRHPMTRQPITNLVYYKADFEPVQDAAKAD